MLQVHGDQIQIQQVILNLIINGMEAMADAANGPRQIIGRTAQLDDNLQRYRFRILVPVSPQPTWRKYSIHFLPPDGGHGHGVSIARTIVEAHGGRIWAENHAAGGAVFRLTLPLAKRVHAGA